MTTEERLEKQLVDWAKSQSGIALKGATNFDTGYPDRLVYVPGAHAHVELKGSSTRYHLNDKQKIWAGRIIASKTPYFIIENDRQLEEFKDDAKTGFVPYSTNVYGLNGDQLIMVVDASKSVYEVLSNRGGTPKRIISGYISDTLANTIYRIFVSLEASFPNTNYCDI